MIVIKSKLTSSACDNSHYYELVKGSSILSIIMGLLCLMFTVLAYENDERELQWSGGGLITSVTSLVSGVSGALLSWRWWSLGQCYCHLVTCLVTLVLNIVSLVLQTLDIVTHRWTLHLVREAWSLLPFTVSYNEEVRQ